MVENLKYCEANSIDILLVSELSRLGRNAFEMLEVVKRLVDNKINLFMQKEQFTLLERNKQPSTFPPIMIQLFLLVRNRKEETLNSDLIVVEHSISQKAVNSIEKSEAPKQKKEKYKEIIVLLKKGIQSAI